MSVWTSLCKSALLPSLMLPQVEDFHTLPPSAALNPSLQPGLLSLVATYHNQKWMLCFLYLLHPHFSLLGNQCSAACCKLVCSCAAEGSSPTLDVLTGEVVRNLVIREVVKQIKGSLVCLAVCRGKVTYFLCIVFGNLVHDDGSNFPFLHKKLLLKFCVIDKLFCRRWDIGSTPWDNYTFRWYYCNFSASRLCYFKSEELKATVGNQSPIFLFVLFLFYK